ncbi:geranylgeranyl reductase family protein [Allobranchiibius sp. GilTou38]|uniref:geranylgeranyl reductase family protein n=1 Tax=Allobranchiibius sp. GilTou38 TaxID=2815210 RepID=UPI001AA0E11D|nr:geranylgeranyl reductase family protein [Allobranchiibius sp. GilTou38]MBO1767268.1 geranylgeranyl reductase family protein [Allobranchiibius sp. GilTou38]
MPYDVIVVGAGPAGSSAAHAAADAGARVLILDRATFPRYKTCGGGLIGPTLAALPQDLQLPSRAEIHRATLTLAGGRWADRRSDRRLLRLVDRASFDHALLRSAQAAGAQTHEGVTVTGVEQDEDLVTLQTSEGPLTAHYVIGADGSASRVARHVDVRTDGVDLGLEVELETGDQAHRWEGRVHLDWGADPGTYAWVFPKGDTLTVGVIQSRGHAAATRAYLARFVTDMGLSGLREIQSSGHLTRCRTVDSPLSRGRVLVAGDAAGLLEPWTREGISYAVRSGRFAGRSVGADGADPAAVRAAYDAAVESTLAREMAAGRIALRAFERSPALMHHIVARTGRGWREFGRLTGGDATLADALEHRSVRWGLRAVGR